jgi:serine/threonine-protein kinase
MAPEQIVVESVDARADLYSLGVVLFRLVTGHLPFETDAGPMVLRHQLFSPVPPPSWLDEGMDPRVEALILNATRKHPDNRYPTMAAFVADLEAILEHADREVGRRPLVRTPDVYVPTTERGREALRVLSQKFGPYASQPPPS